MSKKAKRPPSVGERIEMSRLGITLEELRGSPANLRDARRIDAAIKRAVKELGDARTEAEFKLVEKKYGVKR